MEEKYTKKIYIIKRLYKMKIILKKKKNNIQKKYI